MHADLHRRLVDYSRTQWQRRGDGDVDGWAIKSPTTLPGDFGTVGVLYIVLKCFSRAVEQHAVTRHAKIRIVCRDENLKIIVKPLLIELASRDSRASPVGHKVQLKKC